MTISDGVNQATSTFTGLLRGTPDVSPYVLAIFTSPTQQSGVLDGHPYTIRINAYNPIPVYILQYPSYDLFPGYIRGSIDVSASTNQAPEHPPSFSPAWLVSPCSSNAWYQLSPDASGSDVNGAWSPLASMSTERRFFGKVCLTRKQ